MQIRVHIVIAEPSIIIRSGVVSVLKRLTTLDIDIAEISDISTLYVQLNKYRPDILIVDPSNLGLFSMAQIKAEIKDLNIKIIALQNTIADISILKQYDEVISIYDTSEAIKDKLTRIINIEGGGEIKQDVSAREKDIIICIAKGMTNKQMADKLSLSTHTIMTHRRNITNKLQIHSSAGLTIYAIVNKLVDINEIEVEKL